MEQFDEILPIILAGVTGFMVTFISIPSIVLVAKKKNLLDEPDHRSVHISKIPTLGGIAIFAGFVVAIGIWGNSVIFIELQYIIVATLVVFFIGIKDDILIIAPLTKFLGQIVAALIIITLGGIRITNLHGFFDIHDINYFWSVILSIFVILVITNGFNFIDGVDGLASSIGIITAFTFGFWFFITGKEQLTLLAVAISGSLFAFFLFNVFARNNKIFMGDTGSLIIGLVLSILVIKFNEFNIDKSVEGAIYPAPAVSFGVLIIPLFDLMRVIFIRFLTGKSIFKPDKNHTHHHLLKLGLKHKEVTFILCSVNVLFIAFVFYTAGFISIRRLMLLILILALFLSYIPPFIINKRKNKSKEVEK